jgi:hypothetical protein
VLALDGQPLTPTTPSKARKLLTGGVAKKVWSKFNTLYFDTFEEAKAARDERVATL